MEWATVFHQSYWGGSPHWTTNFLSRCMTEKKTLNIDKLRGCLFKKKKKLLNRCTSQYLNVSCSMHVYRITALNNKMFEQSRNTFAYVFYSVQRALLQNFNIIVVLCTVCPTFHSKSPYY